jgi:hypothetical protein
MHRVIFIYEKSTFPIFFNSQHIIAITHLLKLTGSRFLKSKINPASPHGYAVARNQNCGIPAYRDGYL